jgi:ABC-2 type transport system permease protein
VGRLGGSPIKSLGKYVEMFKVTLQSSLAYAYDVLFREVFLAIVMFVFVQLWRTTYRWEGASDIAGFTLKQMIWYLALSESIVMGMPRAGLDVDNEVKSGSLAYSLNKPYRYSWFHYASYMGEAAVRFLANLAVAGAVTWIMVGPPVFTPASFGAGLVCVVLGYTLDFWAQFSIGLLAFWSEDTYAYRLLYSRVTMLLGGMMLPLDVFPPYLQRFASRLPVSQIVYGPVRTFLKFGAGDWSRLLVRQGLWISVLWTTASVLYGMGVKRVNVQGG